MQTALAEFVAYERARYQELAGSKEAARDGYLGVTIQAAGLVRTARLLARGEVFVPSSVWSR